MVFWKLWDKLTKLSPEAQAALDAETARIRQEWEAIKAQIEISKDAALAANQEEYQSQLSSEHQEAVNNARQKISSSAEETIAHIAQYPTNILNERFERLSRERQLDSLIAQTKRDITRVTQPLNHFNSSVNWATWSIKIWGEVPQDFLDDIEAKRQALLLAQENKIRELEALAQKYEEEKANLK